MLSTHKKGARAAGLAVVLAVVLGCSSGSRDAERGNAPGTTVAATPEELATQAYVWGYPLVVSVRTFQRLAEVAGTNLLFNQDALSGVDTRVIVAPNQDTLYSIAVLDLRTSPMVLTVPDATDRYWTFELLDPWTEAFHYLGTRATGGRGGTFVITPPDWEGTVPAGASQIASPTNQLMLLGRYLINGSDDVPNVRALREGLTLAPLDPAAPLPPSLGTSAGTPQDVAASGMAFFDELGDALAVNPPTSQAERALMARLAPLGIGPGRHPSTEVSDPETQRALARGVTTGEQRIVAHVSETAKAVHGWVVNLHTGTYGGDVLQRAAVAKVGWGANVPEEAVYPRSTTDGLGDAYDGSRRYLLHFDADKVPPVAAFWSLTLYGPDMFFTANPIDRFAIGDRTPGLTYNTDGSLDLVIQHVPPPGRQSNWLPAPEGPFSLMLRLYLPDSSVLDGSYEIPPVTPVG